MKIAPVALAAILATSGTLHAQSFFTTPTRYLTPAWRGSAGTEFSRWDVFYSPYLYGNLPDMNAPNGIGQLSSDAGVTPPPNSDPGDPFAFWNAANPTLTQLNDVDAFIIGGGISGNIYSPFGSTAYNLADTTPFTAGSVVMQWQTDGSLMDFSTIKLVANGHEYTPTNFITEYKTSTSPRGGLTNRTAVQWDLTGLGITSYVISFASDGSSNSMQELLLDTTPIYVEAVASARTRIAASGAWSNTAGWAPDTLPPTGGNVSIGSGTSLTIDGGTREIGELQIGVPGSYSIDAGGGTLKLNTGITATPASATSYTINAPIQMGSFNLIGLNANTQLTVNGVISGSTGLDSFGPGKLLLKADNTFTGGVTVEDGIVEISGANAYTGATNVVSGQLILKANALAGVKGALGNGVVQAAVGGGSEGFPEAALLIDGAFTVARGIGLTAGDDVRKLGGQNTGTGALFSGLISLNSAANNVRLHAEGALDKVTFGGDITGGGAGKTLAKTGAGTVVFSGSVKTFTNNASVASGTLEIASSATLAGSGTLTVNTGATLAGAGSISRATTIQGTHAPGTIGSALTHTGTLAYGPAAHLVWRLAANGTGTGGFDRVAAAAVSVSAGAQLDLNFNAPGSTVNFVDLFWTSSHTWPVLTSTSLSGTFALGTASADAAGHAPNNYGNFSLAHAATGVTLTWTPYVPWELWRRVNFGPDWNSGAIAGELIDTDGDGLRNILEYAFAGDGARFTPSPQPARLGNRLALTFTRNAAATDATISVLGADTLAGPWSLLAQSAAGAATAPILGGVAVTETGSGPTRSVEVRDLYTVDDPAHPRRLMKIEVQRQP